jgi:N-acetylneuraminate lyase
MHSKHAVIKKHCAVPKPSKLSGFFATAFTPLKENGELYKERVRSYYAYLKANQIDGVIVCANYEDIFLSIEEKCDLISAWAEAKLGDNDFSVLLFIKENSVSNIKQLITHAADLNLSGIVMATPEGEVRKSISAIITLFRWYFEDMPIIRFYLDFSDNTTGILMMDLMKGLENHLSSFAGFWYRGQNLDSFFSCMRYKDSKFDILWDGDSFLLPALSLGISAVTGIQFNYLASLYHQLVQAFKNNDQMMMHQLEGLNADFLHLIKTGGTGAAKTCMKLVGMDCGPNKFPLSQQRDDYFKDLCSEMMALRFYDYKSKELKGKASKPL